MLGFGFVQTQLGWSTVGDHSLGGMTRFDKINALEDVRWRHTGRGNMEGGGGGAKAEGKANARGTGKGKGKPARRNQFTQGRTREKAKKLWDEAPVNFWGLAEHNWGPVPGGEANHRIGRRPPLRGLYRRLKNSEGVEATKEATLDDDVAIAAALGKRGDILARREVEKHEAATPDVSASSMEPSATAKVEAARGVEDITFVDIDVTDNDKGSDRNGEGAARSLTGAGASYSASPI